MLSIRIPTEIENRLTYLAKETGRTKSFYVKQALLEYLEDLEDIYLGEKAIENIEAGKSKVYSLKEVEERLGL